MKRIITALAACVLAVSCSSVQTPEEKVKDLLTERFDSLALDCKVVSVSLKDTIRAKLTTADPEYKRLWQTWMDMMEARVDPYAPEFKAARAAMAEYEASWVGAPIAVEYSCTVETDDVLLKSLIESGGFAISLDHSRILGLNK